MYLIDNMDIMLGSRAKTKLFSQGTIVGTLRRWREMLSNFSAHDALSAITMSAMLQLEIPAIAVPCVPRCSTTSMPPKAIAPPVHVVVGALPATPIALQNGSQGTWLSPRTIATTRQGGGSDGGSGTSRAGAPGGYGPGGGGGGC